MKLQYQLGGIENGTGKGYALTSNQESNEKRDKSRKSIYSRKWSINPTMADKLVDNIIFMAEKEVIKNRKQ